MELGLQVSHFSWPEAPASIGPTFGRIARDAEAAGLGTLWVMDHFFQIRPIGPPEAEMLESYSALAFAAGRTSRIGLGALVTGVTYRHPGLLLKTVTTLDVLSGGRAWLGLGAAWYEAEHHGLGVPFPPLAERFERLEEVLQLAHRMFDGDDEPYTGRHYRLERPLNSPGPVPRGTALGRPPILVGGSGERKTLRLVAQYADACNLWDGPPEQVRQKLDVLDRHCAEAGRDPAEVRRTVLARISLSRTGGETVPSGEQAMTVGQAVDKLAALAEVGIGTVIMGMGNDTDPAAYELVAELVAQVTPL